MADVYTVMNTRQPKIRPNLSYAEHLVKILDRKEKELKTKKNQVCEGPLEWPRRKGSHMGTRGHDEAEVSRVVRLKR